MKKIVLLMAVFMAQQLMAQNFLESEPFVHTYSIVARDSITGDMGVAVQSHWFSVGSLVTYGKAGVGVVATQSLVNPSYGPKGLMLMEQGLSPQQALDALLANDSGQMYRQVAFLNTRGEVATHTGDLCIAAAGHRQGKNYSAQANMMLNNTVWNAMGVAFEKTSGSLSERLLAALKAAENEKGDIRGKQSAAILIVRAESTGNSWEDTLMDLRVDDSEHPLDELDRLIKIHRAYDYMNKGDLAMEANNSSEAERLYLQAQQLFPDNLEMQYWYAINLLNNGDYQKAHSILKSVFTKDVNWKTLTERLVQSKLLSIPENELNKVLKL